MINAFVLKLVQNKHTSGAALVYVAAKYLCPILAAWFPSKKPALESTANYLEGLAVFYGFVMAGDAGQNVAGQVPVKPDVPAVPQPKINP